MYKTFTKTLILVFALFIAFFMNGCSKSDGGNDIDSGNYYISFKANGTQMRYTQQSVLSYNTSQSGPLYVGIVSGFNDASSNINLQVHNNAEIVPGTYSGYTLTGGVFVGIIIGYTDPVSGESFVTSALNVEGQITITEIETTGVKGTFSGRVVKSGLSDILITEGSFFVKNNG